MKKGCVLILGGARSGKSRFAQRLAQNMGGPVLFVATAMAGDEEMRKRIEEHRRARPAGWGLLEAATGVGARISGVAGEAKVVVLDCLTLLVSNVLGQYCEETLGSEFAARVEVGLNAEAGELLECIRETDASFVIVSNEVGEGLVPANRQGRLYRDLLGRLNQRLAGAADEVYLMVAGLPVRIKPSP